MALVRKTFLVAAINNFTVRITHIAGPTWNGKSLFLESTWSMPNVTHLYTDAAGSIQAGFGAYYEGRWFNGSWLAQLQPFSIGPSLSFQRALCALTIAQLTPSHASELNLRLFCADLAARSLSHSTIKMYMAAICFWHIEEGYRDPTAAVLSPFKRHTQSTRREPGQASANHNDSEKHQEPTSTDHSPNTPNEAPHLGSIMHVPVLGFFGFLRASEFCSPASSSFNPTIHLCQTDIQFLPQKHVMQVHIEASETDQYRKGTKLQIGATNSSFCPVAAMENFLKHRRQSSIRQPLFTFNNGTFNFSPETVSRTTYALYTSKSGSGPIALQYSQPPNRCSHNSSSSRPT